MAVSSERVQSSIDKWKDMVTVGSIIRSQKSNDRYASMMEKQENKIELEASIVAVKKRKENFMILTANTSNMDEEL
jgi:hypothetical protein